MQFNALLPPASLNPSAVATLLKQIAITSGAEVVFKSMCFELHGLENEVRAAVNMIMELDIVKVPCACSFPLSCVAKAQAELPSRDPLPN